MGPQASRLPLSPYGATAISQMPIFTEAVGEEDPRYANSPFLPLKRLSSRKKGSAIEKIFEGLMATSGRIVLPPLTSDHDRLVDGAKIEVKGSFLWEGSDHFRWQQIRVDQDYDILAVLAFYPDRLEMFGCSHAAAKQHLTVQDADGNWIHNQHGGKKVNYPAL